MSKKWITTVFAILLVGVIMFVRHINAADQAVAESPIQIEPEAGQLGVVRQIIIWSATDREVMAEYPQTKIRLALVILASSGHHVVAVPQDECICEGDKVIVCAIKWHHAWPGANGEAGHIAYLDPNRRPFLRQTVSGL